VDVPLEIQALEKMAEREARSVRMVTRWFVAVLVLATVGLAVITPFLAFPPLLLLAGVWATMLWWNERRTTRLVHLLKPRLQHPMAGRAERLVKALENHVEIDVDLAPQLGRLEDMLHRLEDAPIDDAVLHHAAQVGQQLALLERMAHDVEREQAHGTAIRDLARRDAARREVAGW